MKYKQKVVSVVALISELKISINELFSMLQNAELSLVLKVPKSFFVYTCFDYRFPYSKELDSFSFTENHGVYFQRIDNVKLLEVPKNMLDKIGFQENQDITSISCLFFDSGWEHVPIAFNNSPMLKRVTAKDYKLEIEQEARECHIFGRKYKKFKHLVTSNDYRKIDVFKRRCYEQGFGSTLRFCLVDSRDAKSYQKFNPVRVPITSDLENYYVIQQQSKTPENAIDKMLYERLSLSSDISKAFQALLDKWKQQKASQQEPIDPQCEQQILQAQSLLKKCGLTGGKENAQYFLRLANPKKQCLKLTPNCRKWLCFSINILELNIQESAIERVFEQDLLLLLVFLCCEKELFKSEFAEGVLPNEVFADNNRTNKPIFTKNIMTPGLSKEYRVQRIRKVLVESKKMASHIDTIISVN
ncbi:hypothetical protein J3L16_04240 [Alteromonas sp. 5E99-2]|uniref:hypothetical protein n=1 Tax=Alteromonas sp. 5E99-2 TaxID=2817683 RepID=UPI001A995D3B|nr:hypothetical protein [Alteromonas sp. 5E99-2]MBO1254898.1 hypothetical protein [Alteromonas sp. 5E99-2]